MKYFLLAVLIFVSGCSEDPVKKHLDAKFPPLSSDAQQQKAIQSLALSLSRIEIPAVSVGVEIDEIEAEISKEIRKDPAVNSVRIRGGDQMAHIELDVDKTFIKDEWDDQENIKKILGNSDIRFQGVIYLDLTFKSSIAAENGSRVLTINPLPALNHVTVKKVESNEIQAELAVEALFFLINRYVENINGELSKISMSETRIPIDLLGKENPSSVLESTQDQQPEYTVTIQSNDIVIPVVVGETAILIDKKYLRIIVSLDPISGNEDPTPYNTPTNYDEAKRLFYSLHKEAFGKESMEDKAWVALSKSIVSLSVNRVINQAQACFGLQGSFPTEDIPSVKIDGPDWKSISCESGLSCTSTRDCTFTKSHDSRDCNRCLISVFGSCKLRGNDPVCEALKAAQNIVYESDYTQKKTRCETEKALEKGLCETQKIAEKGLCEAGKEVVKRIALAGPVARINGSIGGKANGNVCLRNIAVESDLSKIHLSMDIGGKVDIRGHLELTPLNLGHTICVAPTRIPLDFDVTIPYESKNLVATMAFQEKNGEFGLAFSTNEIIFPVHLSPSPSDWIISNIDLAIKCPVTNIAKPVIIVATPFVPELRGMTEHKQESTKNFIKLRLPVQKIGNKVVTLKPRANEKALFLTVM